MAGSICLKAKRDIHFVISYLVLSDGVIQYSEVIGFMKKQEAGHNMFKLVHSCLDQAIALTGNHLIYARKPDAEKFYPK